MYFPVPASYAAGNYTFGANVGVYSGTVYAGDSFPFVKSGTDFTAGFVPYPVDGAPNPFDEIVKGDTRVAPTGFALLGAYPNPFNPTTAISYQLSAASLTKLSVYDTAGRQVAELVNGWRDALRLPFDGGRFYSIRQNGADEVKHRMCHPGLDPGSSRGEVTSPLQYHQAILTIALFITSRLWNKQSQNDVIMVT